MSTPSERSLAAKIAANTRWAVTEDRAASTKPARTALHQKFLDEAGGDPVKADNLRRAYFARLALKSARSRRLAREATTAADLADAALETAGGAA